jgi:ribosomal protein L11 methyltransferase
MCTQIYCLNLSAPLEVTSQLAELLSQRGDNPPAVSIHETGNPSIWALDAYYQIKPDLNEIKSFLETGSASPLPAMAIRELEDRDWVALVQSGLSPIRAGRYFIHGSHDRSKATQLAGEIEIDAGQAFGTAHHGTTMGCLLALDHLFKSRQRYRFYNVLDLGTGTGLLAIAAARSLHHKILASDIDPISVKIATENAALNNVRPLVKLFEANGLSNHALQKSAPFDLLIANILAAPLLSMAADIRKNMRPGGRLILSGLLRTQSRTIEARYRGHGFTIEKRLPLDEWMTLILCFH